MAGVVKAASEGPPGTGGLEVAGLCFLSTWAMGVEVAVAVMTTWEELLLGGVPLLLLRPDWRAPPLPDVRPFRLAADDLTAISSLQYRVSGERNPEHYCAPPFSRSPYN